jgi:hypothetical protein
VTAPKKKMPENFRAAMAPRPSACLVCGKKIILTGPRSLKLCPTHKPEHQAKARRHREEWNAKKLREVRGLPPPYDPTQPVAAPETVRPPPPPARHEESERPDEPLPQSQARPTIRATERRYATFEDAIALITAPQARNEGYRHGWIGNTGTGKTTAVSTFLRATAHHFTLIHDDAKLDAQYEGSKVERFEDAPEDATAITMRGDPFKGSVVEVETVAALALQIARGARLPVRLVVDELDRACTPGGKELESTSLRTAFTTGRALNVSILWLTQTPQRAPIAVIDQSSTIALCQLGPRALNYLDDRLCFDPELLQVVPDLPVGAFVIYEAGRPWNRTVYQTPAP